MRQILNWFRRRNLEAEMAEEMRQHLELQTRRYRAAGMSADEAMLLAEPVVRSGERIEASEASGA